MNSRTLFTYGTPVLLLVLAILVGGYIMHETRERHAMEGAVGNERPMDGRFGQYDTPPPVESGDTMPASTPGGDARMADPDSQAGAEAPAGKLKVGNFVGKLEKVDTGCFADGECYVEVDGKHITTTIGWSQAEVGSVLGVEGFGDLEQHIGEYVEVYAKDNSDGTYSLYGSQGFYVKLLGKSLPKPEVQ